MQYRLFHGLRRSYVCPDKKPNKSGSTSVQVIVKTKNRKQRVVKTIGSSRDTDEIERGFMSETLALFT